MHSPEKYTHLFFDLDKTLWDFDRDSHEAMERIFGEFRLWETTGIDFGKFYSTYRDVNAGLWEEYRNKEVNRDYLSLHRFLDTLKLLGIRDTGDADVMSGKYVEYISANTHLFPGAEEVLGYLSNKYRLCALTNGFADVQFRKLELSGIGRYFSDVVTSEEAGAHKPSAEIFQYACRKTGADPSRSLMIGDDPEVDLEGAFRMGMDQMFVNYNGMVTPGSYTFEVTDLTKIIALL